MISYICLLYALLHSETAFGFVVIVSSNVATLRGYQPLQARGFGSTSSGFSGKKKPKPVPKKTILKRIEKKYGGTSAKDIAKGTERYISEQMAKLPEDMRLATQLYQQLRQWDARLDSMSILDQTKIPQADLDGSKRARQELDRICAVNQVTTDDLHNLFQRVTWDASADAKAAKALVGKMSSDIEARINKIFGVDLSTEMVRNAIDLYPESLHDLPDQRRALQRASELLRPGGSIVVVHAQGSGHVERQVQSNPVLVKKGLPNESELNAIADELELSVVISPSNGNSLVEEGYLAVLEQPSGR